MSMYKEKEPGEQEELDSFMEIGHNEYIQLKKKYDHAIATNKESFHFNGKILLTAYAKYMIDYIRSKTNW